MKTILSQLETDVIQFTRNNFDEVIKFTDGKAHEFTTERCINGRCRCRVTTSSGCHIINENDYVIKDKNGDCYPCDQYTYNKTFEEIRRRYEEV